MRVHKFPTQNLFFISKIFYHDLENFISKYLLFFKKKEKNPNDFFSDEKDINTYFFIFLRLRTELQKRILRLV